MRLLVQHFCRMLRFIFKKKKLSLTVPVEQEMGLPGHHFVEIKSAQQGTEKGKHLIT